MYVYIDPKKTWVRRRWRRNIYSGHDVELSNIIIKSILAIAKETIAMGRYHDASHSFPPLKIKELRGYF